MTEAKKVAKKPAKKAVKKTGFKNSVKGKDKAQFKASHSYVVFSVIMMSVEALIIVVLGMALTTISNGPKYTVDKDGNVTKVKDEALLNKLKMIFLDNTLNYLKENK